MTPDIDTQTARSLYDDIRFERISPGEFDVKLHQLLATVRQDAYRRGQGDSDDLLRECRIVLESLIGIAQASIVNARNRNEFPQIIQGLERREEQARQLLERLKERIGG